MSYKVLARKWRPANFDELVGQSHVQKTLSSALEQQRLHHAYLFTGTRGVGKTTIARIMAKCLNCEEGVTHQPCGVCASCVEINEGRFVDLIEVDAASKTKVDDTRELLENVQYRPTRGRYKIYLIDEVHMLSKHSFNALLKTLEEPPPHVIFLLATTDPQMLPATVLSRCLQFHLKNMTQEEIKNHLSFILQQEGITFQDPALDAIAWSAKGSMRDSLSLLDQAIAYGNGAVNEVEVKEMLGSIDRNQVNAMLLNLANGNLAAVLEQINTMDEFAPNYHDVMDEISQTWHRVALCQQVPDYLPDSMDSEQIQQLANLLDPQDVQLFYQIALTSKRDLHLAPTAKSGLEMSLLRMHSFKPGTLVNTGEPGAPVAEKKSLSSSEQASNQEQQPKVKAQAPTLQTEPEMPEHLRIPEHVALTEEVPPETESIQLADILGENVAKEVVPEAPIPETKPEQPPEQTQTASSWDINSILRPVTTKSSATEESIEKPEPEVNLPSQEEQLIPEPQVPEVIVEQVQHVEQQVEPSADPVKESIDTVELKPTLVESPIEPETTPVATLADLSASNWYQVVDNLELTGITEQIMLATQVESVSAQSLVLHLESRLWNMLSAEQLNQISVLLHQRFESDFSVSIETEQPKSETPGQRRQRLIAERLAEAVDHLEHDPVVLAFKNKFNSHLDKASVEPIK